MCERSEGCVLADIWGLGFLMADVQEGGRSQVCLAPGCFSFLQLFAMILRLRKMTPPLRLAEVLSTAFTATHTPSSRISSLLIKAAEHFGVMNCTSGEQSLIYGQEQESRPSVTFPLTLNTLISIHSINFRGPCTPIPMAGTQKQQTQSH